MIVAGIGMRSTAQQAQVHAALKMSTHPIAALACLEQRAAPLRPLAQQMGLPLFTLSEQQIAGVPTHTQSPRILARFATGSVAEATALAALSPQTGQQTTRLIAPRWVSACGHITIALAEGSTK
ncbi:cobalamin biosynthesis protein [Thalassobius sp. S69A]|uniref:cobalamin biosynthesis protein n=1 Tax=unclassified Thalassovita TaxID=2619711 RepID=UPI000C10EFEE|nr:precorrin methylase [Paracoccaceae bacterium]MBT25968.1 precorrin methylase [Paracoccaceae bacterium]